MPMVIPLIPMIASAATAAFGIGKTVYDMQDDKNPDRAGLEAQKADMERQQMQAKQQQEAMQAAAIRRAAPDAQAQTGGALTDSGFAQLVASLSGNTGAGDLAKTTLFGGDSGGLYDSFMSMSSPVSADNGMPQMAEMGA